MSTSSIPHSVVPSNPYSALTLDDISRRKAEVKKQLDAQKQVIGVLCREAVAPLKPAAKKTNVLMRAFNTGMAVFDGVMIGVRFMRRMRRAFRR